MLVDQLKYREEVLRRWSPQPPPLPHHHLNHERDRELQTAGGPQPPPPPGLPPSPPAPPIPPPTPPPAVFTEELGVLTELYAAAGGSTWALKQNWLNGYPCDEPIWQGVICSLPPPRAVDAGSTPSPPPGEAWENGGRVHRVLLDANGLNGTLPTALGKL